MRTKQLFKTRLLSFAALCCLALAAVSCANEDIAQNGTGSDNNKIFATFVASEPTKTRTSMDYATGNFYWEEGDKIYVKDDDGTLQVSNAVDAAHAHSASFKFKVPGKFENSATYKVYYLGKNSSNNEVAIPTAQTQTMPNSTKHLGDSGDYGTATATGTLGGSVFSFQLEHQTAFLVFQPYTSNYVLKNCYLTKIEVSSDDDITETYKVDPITGNLKSSNGGKQIVLTTKDPTTGSANENGFPLTNTTPNVAVNGAYIPIKPGTHALNVRYWVKDIATQVEGAITKVLPSFNYDKNTYYDMTANLNVKDYDGDHYYMWDAEQQYWYGYEWTKNLPIGIGQPTLQGQLGGKNPKNNSDSNNRWYNESFVPHADNLATHSSCKDLPNVNEMSWYTMKGDPRWDNELLWTTMGHLYKGGMWFLKHDKITGYSNTHAYDNTDWRTNPNGQFTNYILTPGIPSSTDINNYFFLPALGTYTDSGQLVDVGVTCNYWSSSASPITGAMSNGLSAFGLGFYSGGVYTTTYQRKSVFRVYKFE